MPQIFVLPRQVALDDDANPLSGALLYFFQTGSTTPQAVYIDSDLTTAHSNPVVADSSGEFPKIYLNSEAEVDYRVRLTTAAGVQLYQEDNISRFSVTDEEIGRALYRRTAAEQLAGVTPSNYSYPESNVKRYGALGDRTTDDLAAFNRAASVAVYTKKVFIPALQAGYYYKLSGAWVIRDLDSVEVFGEGTQSLLVIANSSGANCITVDSTVQARFHHFGIYGTAGSGNGIELINDAQYNQFSEIWMGWLDGDGFKNTLGISTRLNNIKIDQNNGYRPASLVGLSDGSIKRGIHVPSTVTARNNDFRAVNCVVNAAGEVASLVVGTSGGIVVESFSFVDGLLQGASSWNEVYFHTKDAVIANTHIESSAGVATDYIITMDVCTNTWIDKSGVNGDVRLIGACQQSGLTKCRIAGVDIGASTDRCAVEDSSYSLLQSGPGAGVIKDRAQRSRLRNLINASNDNFASGDGLRNPSTYMSTNMETWVGGASPTVPCGLTSFGTPTITRESTAAHVRSGGFSASVAHSSDLDEGLQVVLEPINQFAGRQVAVEAWVKNITTAGLAYIGMSEGGGVSVYQPSFLADTFERMVVTFKIDAAASSATLKFTGLTGTVKWDSIKITCEEHTPVLVRSFDGTATPSVSYGGNHVPYFVTQGTPTITNFLEPHVGKPFVIRFDGATVITDSDPIRLAGAGNFTGASGDMIALVYCDDGFFRQIAPESVL
jgi:hypothetical protein